VSGGAKNIGTPRLEGRNGRIWQMTIMGKTQEAIAEELGIDQSTVSRAIAAVRASIPEVDKAQAFQRELDFLDQLRAMSVEIANMPAAPVTAGKDGDVVLDPETGAVVRDYGGKLAAMDRAVKMHERYAKLLGLEAPTKVDMTVQEQVQQAAQAAAADALTMLHGGE
jgi:DNA-binding transcriptional regulator YbjK